MFKFVPLALFLLLFLAAACATPPPDLDTACPWPDCGAHGTCLNSTTLHHLCDCHRRSATDEGFWDLNWSALLPATATPASIANNFSYRCDQCLPLYYGLSCDRACPGVVNASAVERYACSGHGACDWGVGGSGACTCSGNWAGVDCGNCATGWFGADCSLQCSNCSSVGAASCDDGTTGTGACTCKNSHTGVNCSRCNDGFFLSMSGEQNCTACPTNPTTGEICSKRGRCLAPDPLFGGGSDEGVCWCDSGFSGTACESTCANCNCGGAPCKSCPACDLQRGRCNNQTGKCECTATGYFGALCDQSCPLGLGGKVCSGHGVCNTVNGTCECANDLAGGGFDGVWNGSSCSKCHYNYTGGEATGCTRPCPLSPLDGVTLCSGHGTCVDGVCSCEAAYCGKACQSSAPCAACPANTFGRDCEFNCTCQNGATCSAGRTGDGSCSCVTGYVGAQCQLLCPGASVGVSVCSGRGTCSNVTWGAGGSEVAVCSSCDPGYALSDCSRQCNCNGHGTCSDGVNGTGECVRCDPGYVAPSTSCANLCACAELVAGSGRFGGECAKTDGTCTCGLRFTGAACDRCVSGWSGQFCEVACINGTTSSGSDRGCSCTAQSAGAGCEKLCPVSATTGEICSLRGSCSNGNSGTGLCSCNEPALWGGSSCGCNVTRCTQLLGVNGRCDPDAEDSCICDAAWAQPSKASTLSKNSDADQASAASATTSAAAPSTAAAQQQTTTAAPVALEQCSACNASVAWGAGCSQKCACEPGHGECDPLTGACKCFADRERGFWSGTLCRSCLAAYAGRRCDQPLLPSLTQLPSLTSDVPSARNTRSTLNEKVIAVFQLPRTKKRTELPQVATGTPVSALVTVTTRAVVQHITGEEYKANAGQRVRLEIAAGCLTPAQIQEEWKNKMANNRNNAAASGGAAVDDAAAGIEDRLSGVEIAATWARNTRLYFLRRCLNRSAMIEAEKIQQEQQQQQNSSSFDQSHSSSRYHRGAPNNNNNNAADAPIYTSKWEIVSIPTHQPFTFPNQGFVPNTVISPPGAPASPPNLAGLPSTYDNCSFVEHLATTFHLRDNAPHLCVVCVDTNKWVSNGTAAASSSGEWTDYNATHRVRTQSIHRGGGHHPSKLACFQIQEFNDGSVSVFQSESAVLDLTPTPAYWSATRASPPIEVVDTMRFDQRLDELIVFGSRSDAQCVGVRVPLRRGRGHNEFTVFMESGALASFDGNPGNSNKNSKSNITSASVCNSVSHLVPLAETEEALTKLGVPHPPPGSVRDWTAVAYNTGSPLYRARILLCNFSSFLSAAEQQPEVVYNWTSNASVAVPHRTCVHPQNEASGAQDRTDVGAVTFDPVLKMLFVSVGTWGGVGATATTATSKPPFANYDKVWIKRFQLLDGASNAALGAASAMIAAGGGSDDDSATATAALSTFLSHKIVRLDGVQLARNKGGSGHAAGAVSEHGRQLFLAERGVEQEKHKQLTIDRISLIFVDAVTPQRVDARGGTHLTITGRGFAIAVSRFVRSGLAPVAQCRLGSVVRDARVISETEATCDTVARTTDGCSGAEIVSLALEGSTFAYSTMTIQRVDPPSLRSATPSSGRFAAPLPIVLEGDGLTDLGYTRCIFYVLVKNGTALATPENHTVAARAIEGTNQQQQQQQQNSDSENTDIRCDAPPILSVPWNGQVDVTLDGSVYSGSPLSVQFFGDPAAIVMRTTQLAVASAPVTMLPPMLVDIVDMVGQTVSANVLQIPVFAEAFVVSFFPDADAGDAAKGKKILLEGPANQIVNLQLLAFNAPATITFDNLFVQLPPSGILNLGIRVRPTEQNSALRFDYRTSVRVSVTPGKLARIAIVREPSQQIDPLGKLAQEPLIAPVDDAGNNLNLNSFDGIILGVAVLERPLPRVSALSQALLGSFVAVPNRNQSVVCARGGCDLSALDPINARYGFSYTYYLWEMARPAVALQTRVMLPSCATGSFRRLGGYVCEPCIPHTRCLASGEMVVDAGYWRPSEFALTVYDCFPPEACPGGNRSAACAAGYSGPRCSVCESDRGKSVTDRCQPCTTLSKVAFIMSVVVVAIAIILFVVYVVQNWDDPDRHVTTLQLALTQMQLLVAMTDLEFDYPSWYRQMQSWIALLSDVRIFESSNADCTLRPEGATFFTRFVTYVCTPLMALLVAGVAWIVLYLNPMLFRFSQSLDADYSKSGSKRLRGANGSSFQAVGDTLPARLRRRWDRKQKSEHGNEEEEIRLALKDLLNGSDDDEDEEAIESAKMLAQISGRRPRLKNRNPPLPRTGIAFLMLTAQQVILFFMYPSTVQYSLSMQNCLEVDDGAGSLITYLKVDPTISCDTPTYLGFKFTALVFGLGMLFGIPILYIVAHYVHGRLRPSRRRERAQIFSFLMQGVRPRRWYYPALIFLRKGFSTAVVAFFRAPLDAYFTMWGLIFYLPGVYFLKPYLRNHHNMLELLAVSATIVAINLSLVIYAVPNNETVSTLCSAIIVVMMSCILLLFGYISTAKMRYIMWGRARAYFGHITSSESEDEIDFEAEKKALAEPLLHGEEDESSTNNKKGKRGGGGAATGTGRSPFPAAGEEMDEADEWVEEEIVDENGATQIIRRKRNKEARAAGVTIADIEGAERNDADHIDGTKHFAEIKNAERREQRQRNKIQQAILRGGSGRGRRGGGGNNNSDSDLDIIDAVGPGSTQLLQDRLFKQQQNAAASPVTLSSSSAASSPRRVRGASASSSAFDGRTPSSPAGGSSAAAAKPSAAPIVLTDDDDDDANNNNNDFSSWTADGDDVNKPKPLSSDLVMSPRSVVDMSSAASPTAASVSSPRQQRHVPSVTAERVMAEQLARTAALAEERKARQSYSHAGDADEVVRYKRKPPEQIDYASREKKLREELEAKREQRRQDKEREKQKQLEASPYVYVPKVKQDESLVQGLSQAQRLEILGAPHLGMQSLVANGGGGASSPAAASSPRAASSAPASSASPQRQPTAVPRGYVPSTHDSAQQVLEQCFQNRFEVNTRNLDRVVEQGRAEMERSRNEIANYARASERIAASPKAGGTAAGGKPEL